MMLNLFSTNNLFGQKTKATTRTTKEREVKSSPVKTSGKGRTIKRKGADDYWMFGIGGNVVDDDGSPFKYLFNAGPRWNLRPYPTRLTVEKSLKHTFSIEGVFNFNLYKGNKIINGDLGKSGIFLSGDLNLKNDFNRMAKNDGWINPYVVYGLGTTFRTVRSRPIGGNLNIGFGLNIWLSKMIGINFQSIAKFGVSRIFPKSSSNYLQHSTGVVIKLQEGGKSSFLKRRYKWIDRKNIGRERV
ncbi:MAG: hypothetical protein Q8T03_07905 [Bacteroidota bacterium]|nr:hypothetical protein [Bacteroidota bacterium]MDP3557284.1 hypothetical protein [Bacteroidota bacterium]